MAESEGFYGLLLLTYLLQHLQLVVHVVSVLVSFSAGSGLLSLCSVPLFLSLLRKDCGHEHTTP